MLFIFGQYVHPILVTAAEIHSTEGYSLRFFGRILKMSVPCVMCWILFFFANFQAVANICSELTYFADREFFKEWWNCRTFAEYWKLWNLPVHNWILKHMYYPMLRKNVSPIIGNCISFFVSAVLHEYMMGFSFFLPTWYFFVGMFANFFAIIGETFINKIFHFDKSNVGNAIFWLQFCIIGQPMIICLYYVKALNEGIIPKDIIL